MAHERVLAYRYAGQRYDCGSKLGYLKATTAMGLKHPETAEGFAAFLAELRAQQA
jgi:UTP--glucose-1-phosphate uridylyltransferase